MLILIPCLPSICTMRASMTAPITVLPGIAPKALDLSSARGSVYIRHIGMVPSKTIFHVWNSFLVHAFLHPVNNLATSQTFVNWKVWDNVSMSCRRSRNLFPDAGCLLGARTKEFTSCGFTLFRILSFRLNDSDLSEFASFSLVIFAKLSTACDLRALHRLTRPFEAHPRATTFPPVEYSWPQSQLFWRAHQLLPNAFSVPTITGGYARQRSAETDTPCPFVGLNYHWAVSLLRESTTGRCR